MRVITIVSLGASAVLGLAALVVAKAVLPHANAGPGVQAVAAAARGLPVVVAKTDLKFGDRLDAGKLTVLQVPANAVPQGAFTTIDQVLAQDHGGPPVALTAIAARELLLPAKLSGPGARASVAAEIGDGLRAYTIKVSDVTGVGGHALPGDRVDVVLMRDLTPKGDLRSYVSQVVIQNVRVLGVDLNTDQAANKPSAPSTATLEVTVEDAQKLAVAADLGKLSLALRKTGAVETADTTLIRTGSFAQGGGGGGAPVRSGGPRRSGGGGFAGPGLILIVEGGRHGGKSHASGAMPPAPATAPAASLSSPDLKAGAGAVVAGL